MPNKDLIAQIKIAKDIAVAAEVPLQLTAEHVQVLLDEITRLSKALENVQEEIADAQLIDLTWQEAKAVRADMLKITREALYG